MRLPRGLGYLAFTMRRGLGATSAPTQPQFTVAQLLSQIGQGSLASTKCDCTSSKYCSSSTAGCPTNQYAACSYWGASVRQRMLCWPCPSPWISGATMGVGTQVGIGVTEAASIATPITSLVAPLSIAGPIGAAVGAVAGLITNLFGSAHAAAQKAQANAIASGVPAANQSLQQIDAGLANGSIGASQATSLYGQLQSQFTSLMKQGTSYKTGDALWACDIALQLVIAARKADLKAGFTSSGQPLPSAVAAASAGSPGAAVGSSAASAVSPLSSSAVSKWIPIAAVLAAGFFLFTEL